MVNLGLALSPLFLYKDLGDYGSTVSKVRETRGCRGGPLSFNSSNSNSSHKLHFENVFKFLHGSVLFIQNLYSVML